MSSVAILAMKAMLYKRAVCMTGCNTRRGRTRTRGSSRKRKGREKRRRRVRRRRKGGG
jgi:hypothetical protein